MMGKVHVPYFSHDPNPWLQGLSAHFHMLSLKIVCIRRLNDIYLRILKEGEVNRHKFERRHVKVCGQFSQPRALNLS